MKSNKTSQKQRENSVEGSSRLEGGSLIEAKKNTKLIERLKKYGRAFSV